MSIKTMNTNQRWIKTIDTRFSLSHMTESPFHHNLDEKKREEEANLKGFLNSKRSPIELPPARERGGSCAQDTSAEK